MTDLIPTINQLQDVCSRIKIPLELELPQIVVVGIQSSGKSSLMESIVRREFIPRGDDLVTRRPLEIRLTRSADPSDWAKFGHTDKKFTDFDEVRDEIEQETNRLCGSDREIKEDPIVLSIHSKDVVDLTLLDLPGIVRVPVGSQPQDINVRTRELARKYIANLNSIILVVVAANVDIVTSEAFELAREVDPDGKRTLVVVTKFDTVIPTAGTKILDKIRQTIPRCLGVIAVVNRSTDEPQKSVEQAIKDESDFFRSNYPKFADKNGLTYLSKRLSHLLKRHIREVLPDLRSKIDEHKSDAKKKLESFGDPVDDKQKTLITVLHKFANSYNTALKIGQRSDKQVLLGGARVAYILERSFPDSLSTMNPLGDLDHEAILTISRNLNGSRPWICIHSTIEFLAEREVGRLESPSLQCVHLVYKEMKKIEQLCSEDVKIHLQRFPNLRKKIQEILTRLLDAQLPVTEKAVRDQISFAKSHLQINTVRPIAAQPGHNFEHELHDCELIAEKARDLFNVRRDMIGLMIPGVIKHCMINNVNDNILTLLFEELYHSDELNSLLMESDEIEKKREDIREIIDALDEASEIIDTIHR